MNGFLDLFQGLFLVGFFLMWLGHTRHRRPIAPSIYRDPLDNPFGRREWYTSTGNKLRITGALLTFIGGGIALVRLVELLAK